MSHPRQDWSLDRYIQELIYLDDMSESMDTRQVHETFELIKREIIARFPKEEREKQALIF